MRHQFTDKELFDKMKLGDNEAFKIIYKKYRANIINQLQKKGHNNEDAIDIFQIALARLYEKISSGQITELWKGKTIGALLSSFVRNVSSEIFNKNKKAVLDTYLLESLIEKGEDKAKQEANFQLIERSLIEMGNPCKSLLEAFYFEKKSYVQIRELFKYKTIDSAKNAKAKCLKRLKKLISNH